MPTIDTLKQTRIDKIDALHKQHINPYPSMVKRDSTIGQARLAIGKTAAIVGRLRALRGHGKIFFGDLVDESGKIQIVWKADVVQHDSFACMPLVDIGDFIAAQGEIGQTQAGEVSLFITDFQIVSKSIRPLPDEWYGLKDTEERFRKRYLDLLLYEEVKKTMDARWDIERAIRTFLWGEGYKEVETPVLQPLYGGTNARPFTTHLNALDTDFYLRIAPELYLKRLMVGGYERVFEIARNFRNEGMDLSHQPEFTMMEFYEAYADYHRIMDLTEGLIKHAAQTVNQSYVIAVGDVQIDVSHVWRRITVDEALKTYEHIDWETVSDDEIKKRLTEGKIQVTGVWSRNKALFALYDHFVTPKLIEPTWVIDYPREVSPLSKAHRSKEGRVERFEGYIGGKEICDGWSEINSALEQRSRFDQEQRNLKAGDAEAQPLDEDFLTALEYGCPPMGGIGIGIDRLVMFLTNTWSIREVIPFPLMRPEVSMQHGVVTKTKNDDTQENGDIHIDRIQAQKLIEEHIQDPITRMHVRESEVIMQAVAKRLGFDQTVWGIIGLLHDIDWEETKTNTKKHGIRAAEIVKKAGGSDFLIETIQSHVYGQGMNDLFMGPPEFKDKKRSTVLQHALAASETLTGLIVATALIQPEKKLAAVKLDSLKKKFNTRKFAAGCNREIIRECEQIDIPIDEFLHIGLQAMQQIHGELSL